jgi:RNA recognition motif-containing protein
MSRRLYAGNLSFDANDGTLREIFARVGGVEHAEVIKDRATGLFPGFWVRRDDDRRGCRNRHW